MTADAHRPGESTWDRRIRLYGDTPAKRLAALRDEHEWTGYGADSLAEARRLMAALRRDDPSGDYYLAGNAEEGYGIWRRVVSQ